MIEIMKWEIKIMINEIIKIKIKMNIIIFEIIK